MQRGELLITLVLAALILAGSAYQGLRCADKTAEMIVTHPTHFPFAAQQPPPVSPQSATSPVDLPPVQSSSANRLLSFINRASLSELEILPGIGPVLAQRILQKREQLGRFEELNDLLQVSGIGKGRLSSLLDGMAIQNTTPAPTTPVPTVPVLNPRIPKQATRIPHSPPPVLSSPSPGKRPLNQATREELMAVPGIGEHLADTLLQARAQKGGFRSWEDVASVSGIGAKRLQKIQESFSLSNVR